MSLLQAEESGKLAAQKEARLARQRLAQAQVSGAAHVQTHTLMLIQYRKPGELSCAGEAD